MVAGGWPFWKLRIEFNVGHRKDILFIPLGHFSAKSMSAKVIEVKPVRGGWKVSKRWAWNLCSGPRSRQFLMPKRGRALAWARFAYSICPAM
jgi:hypothetical protein